MALFITKKGTFGPMKKLGGGGHVPIPTPLANWLRLNLVLRLW